MLSLLGCVIAIMNDYSCKVYEKKSKGMVT